MRSVLKQVSAGGACAGGWSSGEFPDAFPFLCGTPVASGQRANMYGCNVGALAHSGYTPGADDTVCGCPDWEAEQISAPAISTCVGSNKEWVTVAQPWAQYLKAGCPTAYTFPFDDQTSTFDCVDGDDTVAGFVNTQSCECPLVNRVFLCMSGVRWMHVHWSTLVVYRSENGGTPTLECP